MSNKKQPIGGYAPGNYQRHCVTCGGGFIGDKRAVQCEPCAIADRDKFDALTPEEQKGIMESNAERIKEMLSKRIISDKKCICNEPYDSERHEGGYPRCPVHDKPLDLAVIGHGKPVPDNALYETRLALRMVLKVFKNTQKTKEQEKYYSQGEYMLQKHFKITDVLRTEQPVEQKEAVDWIDVNDQLPKEGGRYWCYVQHLTDIGMSCFQWNCDYNPQLRRFSDMTLTKGEQITHWRELPEPPKKNQC